ncbi:beta family protein [Amycolatopsis sp. EV170708-02-1]|uniref:beta family protein n=1 Tax=Amycolatopsis sp. EV170708-02-1 TaxID=2919322 RepID=UPI001F0C0D56|nr:beta family protein [Amycolatopsis sp. EV170708-02-1]UMO99598.1 beta family protein [Amycolatopsis sp. EV170708-02-1]
MNPVRPLVAVKAKLGELTALASLRSHGASARVMVELLDSVTPTGRILPALVRAAAQAAHQGRTLWLDTTWLTANSPLVQQPGGVFEFLDHAIEVAAQAEYGLFAPDSPYLVPVVTLDATENELRRVRLLLEHQDRDVAIRLPQPGGPLRELLGRIDSIMRSTGTRQGRVHMILDAGFVESVRPGHAAAAAETASALSDLLGPAKTTLLAGSIPAKRTTYVTTERDRPEVTLWNEVRHARTNEVNYGDYGVTHPRPPRSDGQPRTPNPYLCYTVPGKTVLLRRKVEDGDDPAERFTDLVEELVERADFAGPGYSWGDDELTRCRRTGGRSTGSVSRWVAMATSHHIEHVARRSAADL